MPLRDHWWCILVAKYGVFLFTEIGAFVITDYNEFKLRLKVLKKSRFWFSQKTISPKVIPIHVDNQNLGQGE